MYLLVNLQLYLHVKKKVQLNLHLKIKVHLKVDLKVHMKIKVYMNLQMNLFLHIKVHMKVQKMLQVRVHEGWGPSSFSGTFFQVISHSINTFLTFLVPESPGQL